MRVKGEIKGKGVRDGQAEAGSGVKNGENCQRLRVCCTEEAREGKPEAGRNLCNRSYFTFQLFLPVNTQL